MVSKQIAKTIQTYDLIRPHQHIVLGLSGGPDSVCLFHVLRELAGPWDLTLHPVHINHRLRPGDAEADQAYVERLCRDAGCPARVFVVDCRAKAAREKRSSEEAGREARYAAFRQVAQELADSGVPVGDIRIAVAQNADDQAETILFRLLRGAGIDGLAGMQYCRRDAAGFAIVRPLLDIPKAEILAYCARHGLQPRTDHTNAEPIYTRNRLRLELLPQLRDYNPNIRETLCRLGKTAAADRSYLWSQAEAAWAELAVVPRPGLVRLSGAKMRALHPAVRQRVLRKAAAEAGCTEELTFRHVSGCEAVLLQGGPSAQWQLPGGYVLRRVYGDLEIAAPAAGSHGTAALRALPELRVRVLDPDACAALTLPRGSYALFDLAALEAVHGDGCAARLCVRTRAAGDVLAIAARQTKKLQDYFVDARVPRERRDRLPLVALDSEILWIPPQGSGDPGRYSAKYRLTTETKKGICVELFGNL